MKRSMAGRTFYFVNYYQSKSLDTIVTVKDPDSVLELCLINTQAQYGNGSIVRLLINGREIRSFDCIVPNPEATADNKEIPKHIFDQQLRQWLVPLRGYVGKQILISAQVDNKAQNNADSQWITIPKVFSMKIQEIQREFPRSEGQHPRAVRPPTRRITQPGDPRMERSAIRLDRWRLHLHCRHPAWLEPPSRANDHRPKQTLCPLRRIQGRQ